MNERDAPEPVQPAPEPIEPPTPEAAAASPAQGAPEPPAAGPPTAGPPSPEPPTAEPTAGSLPEAIPEPPAATAPAPRHPIALAGRIEFGIRALLVANVAVIALLMLAFISSLPALQPGHPAQASPSMTFDLMSMGLAHIPTSNSCLLCHETGGEGGLKPIPAIGHELEGWRRCATCHTNTSLGRTASGHVGIPEEECLNCHKLPPEGPSITQPHSRLQDQQCLDCHGSYAHLPSSMVGRNQDECWLCHKPTALPPPEYPHVKDPATGCRECHTSAQVGGLPIDHARYSSETCLLCHEIRQVSPAP